jgi:hypothetical protein
MGVMQVAIDEVIDVVPVRDGLVTATRTVVVRPVVRAARVRWRAGACVAATDADAVLLHPGAVGMMQVPVVQIVDVAFVHHRGMTAIRAVLMRMVCVRMIGHGQSPSSLRNTGVSSKSRVPDGELEGSAAPLERD